jgi:hypothetical protein
MNTVHLPSGHSEVHWFYVKSLIRTGHGQQKFRQIRATDYLQSNYEELFLFSTLKMEAVRSSKSSLNIYQSIRRHILDDSTQLL